MLDPDTQQVNTQMADAHDLRSIFWQTLPVSLRRGDTEEYLQELNVRVLLGRGASGQAIKVKLCLATSPAVPQPASQACGSE